MIRKDISNNPSDGWMTQATGDAASSGWRIDSHAFPGAEVETNILVPACQATSWGLPRDSLPVLRRISPDEGSLR